MSGVKFGPKTEMEMMGVTNSYWGVCGFTSSFHAMYELNPGKRPLVIGAGIATKVLAEIKTYLIMLKASGNFTLLTEIEQFTQTFPSVNGCDFKSFKIDNYISLINDSVGKSEAEVTGNGYYSIGMPPNGVADYVDRMWGYKATVSKGDTGADGIIGVKRDGRKMYDGLCHYMYRTGGKIYSWGNTYNSVTGANPAYQVIWTIDVKP
jgi:hypothetical protein